MDDRETQLSSSSNKHGGWTTFPFWLHHRSLSLSLSLSKTHRICWINMFLISIDIKQGWRQASHLEAGRRGMDIKPYCISNSGVQYEKHKCCSDFKHNEWLHQFASGHWSNCCWLFLRFSPLLQFLPVSLC